MNKKTTPKVIGAIEANPVSEHIAHWLLMSDRKYPFAQDELGGFKRGVAR